MPIFPVHIPVMRAIDGPALEKRLREKGLEDKHIHAVLDAMKDEGLIQDEASTGNKARIILIAIMLVVMLCGLSLAIALKL